MSTPATANPEGGDIGEYSARVDDVDDPQDSVSGVVFVFVYANVGGVYTVKYGLCGIVKEGPSSRVKEIGRSLVTVQHAVGRMAGGQSDSRVGDPASVTF